ncbi:MAG: universal stress protein [Microscillaceae bacterium]|nr:universal stress protein [Microscillaceae bacterium]
MKTILVPTDFSDPANNALSLAVQMAQKTQGEVILLNVIEPIKSYVAATDGMYIDASVEQKYLDYLKENAQLQMDILKDKAEFTQANIRTEVSLGTIFSAIQDKVSRESVDLIVMGTQGVSGLDEILIGSNTEKVVRTAPCPVLAVKEKRDLSEFKNLLFATSLKKRTTPGA